MRNVHVLGSRRGIGAFCSLLNAVISLFYFFSANHRANCWAENWGERKMFHATNCFSLKPPQMRGVRFVKLLEKSRLPCIHIIYQHQWVPYSLPVGGFPCRWAGSPWAGVAAAGAERVKLCLLFQVGAKSHCKMFFPPLALRVVLKLNWFWLANKNRTAKLNFLRNVVNPMWKINPKMCFPSCTLCLVFVLLGLPSPSLCSLHRRVSGWQGCCPYAEVLWWAAVGANGSWDILAWPVHFFSIPHPCIVLYLVLLLLCSRCPPSPHAAWGT